MGDNLKAVLESKQLSKYSYCTKAAVLRSIKGYRSDCRRVVFLGDSLTDFGEWNEMVHKDDVVIYNRGISGDTINGVQNRLDSITCLNPHKIFLMIGINNLFLAQEVVMASREYGQLLDNMIEKCHTYLYPTQIFLLSVLPINSGILRNPYIKDNQKVVRLNEEIAAWADKKGLTYIDIFSEMLDLNGQLDIRYTIDGCHLTYNGYKVWFSCIKDLI